MPKIYACVCYLCYQKGELKEATHTYVTKEEEYDICNDCAELCKKEGFTVSEIIGEMEITEE